MTNLILIDMLASIFFFSYSISSTLDWDVLRRTLLLEWLYYNIYYDYLCLYKATPMIPPCIYTFANAYGIQWNLHKMPRVLFTNVCDCLSEVKLKLRLLFLNEKIYYILLKCALKKKNAKMRKQTNLIYIKYVCRHEWKIFSGCGKLLLLCYATLSVNGREYMNTLWMPHSVCFLCIIIFV